MNSFFSITTIPFKYYQRYEFIIFAGLLLLAVLNGQTTVFYIIYFFWWNEFIRIIVGYFFSKRSKKSVELQKASKHIIPDSFFLMGIYLVLIIVFFGFIANWNNQELVFLNMKILFFKNWFFNINLLISLFEHLYFRKTKKIEGTQIGIFTPNMIVLHISIIIGGVLMFFVVKRMPEVFTPDNFWGSVIIIIPFLALKKIIQQFTHSDNVIRQSNT